MLPFDVLDFMNEAKVTLKVTQGISPNYFREIFKIKECNSEDTMTLRSNSNKNLRHQK